MGLRILSQLFQKYEIDLAGGGLAMQGDLVTNPCEKDGGAGKAQGRLQHVRMAL